MFMDRMTHYHDGHSSNRILASLSSAPAAAPSAKSLGSASFSVSSLLPLSLIRIYSKPALFLSRIAETAS